MPWGGVGGEATPAAFEAFGVTHDQVQVQVESAERGVAAQPLGEAASTFVAHTIRGQREELEAVVLEERLAESSRAVVVDAVVLHVQALEVGVVAQAIGERDRIVVAKLGVVQVKDLEVHVMMQRVAQPNGVAMPNEPRVLQRGASVDVLLLDLLLAAMASSARGECTEEEKEPHRNVLCQHEANKLRRRETGRRDGDSLTSREKRRPARRKGVNTWCKTCGRSPGVAA